MMLQRRVKQLRRLRHCLPPRRRSSAGYTALSLLATFATAFFLTFVALPACRIPIFPIRSFLDTGSTDGFLYDLFVFGIVCLPTRIGLAAIAIALHIALRHWEKTLDFRFDAFEKIAPEFLSENTLLRASERPIIPDTLLRPSFGQNVVEPQQLLRASTADEQRP